MKAQKRYSCALCCKRCNSQLVVEWLLFIVSTAAMMCRIDLAAVDTLALIALILSMAYINGERYGQLVNTRSAMVRTQSCRSKTQQSQNPSSLTRPGLCSP
jgi:hypothetical protein